MKMAQEEIKESFREIRDALTRQKAKAPPTSDAIMNDNDLSITAETDVVSADGGANAAQTHAHVAQLCAPLQSSYVPTTTGAKRTSQQDRACYYAPHCQKQASECGGWRKGGCSDFRAKKFTVSDDFLDKKEERKKKEKRQREKERRAEKKKRAKQDKQE